MKVTLSPRTAHYKSGILFFNITSKTITVADEHIVKDADVCFMLNDHFVYVGLGSDLMFYVRETSTGDVFGPYPDPISLVTLHLFGKYDGLVKFLRESFVFDKHTEQNMFVFDTLRYGKFSYDLGGNIVAVTKKIYDAIPPIPDIFEYEFAAKTFYSDGALELFVNKLNVMFNPSNFNEKYQETDELIVASVDRGSGYGARRPDGRGVLFVNMSTKRHAVFASPKTVPVGYFSFESDGTTEGDAFLSYMQQSTSISTISNRDMIELLAEDFGIDQSETEVEIATYSIFDGVFAGIAYSDSVIEVMMFTRAQDGSVVPFLVDVFKKRIKFISYDSAESIIDTPLASLDVEEDSVSLVYDSDEGHHYGGDICLSIGDTSFCVDTSVNRASFSDGNIMAVNYVSGLIRKAFI